MTARQELPTFLHEAPWAKMPLELVFHKKASAAVLRVYAAIDAKCGKRGWWFGPIGDLCNLVGILANTPAAADSTVRDAIKKLSEWKFIQTRQLDAQHDFVLYFAIIAKNVEEPPMNVEKVRRKIGGGSAEKSAGGPPENRRGVRLKTSESPQSRNPRVETPEDLSSPLSSSPPVAEEKREEVFFNEDMDEDDDEQAPSSEENDLTQINARKQASREWWDHLVKLQGAPPFGKSRREWEVMIAELVEQDTTIVDFDAAWAAAKRTWSKPETVHALAVYNNFDKLMPQVRAQREVERKREATITALENKASPDAYTEEDAERGQRVLAAIEERRAKQRAAEEWRHSQDIWTPDHRSGCNCGTCATNKRQYQKKMAATPELLQVSQ